MNCGNTWALVPAAGEVLRKGTRRHEEATISTYLNLAIQHEQLRTREQAVA